MSLTWDFFIFDTGQIIFDNDAIMDLHPPHPNGFSAHRLLDYCVWETLMRQPESWLPYRFAALVWTASAYDAL